MDFRLTTKIAILALCLIAPLQLLGQAWSTFLDPSRAVDWTSGVGFSIPNYTVNCATQPTLTAGSANAGTNRTNIQNAINSCDATHNVVLLPAGTYYISGLDFQSKSNVVLRGAGGNSTFLISTGETSCGGLFHGLCMGDPNGGYNGSSWTQPGGSQACQWTAGYAKGTTTLTLSSCGSAPPLNKMLVLDQKDDLTDTGGVYMCSATTTGCTTESNNYGRNIGGVNYSQTHMVYTTSVTSLGGGSYSVGISVPISANNIRSGQNPGAWWSGFAQLQGIENLSIDGSADPDGTIQMYNCYQCWVKGVRFVNGGTNDVALFQSLQDVVRDSYFFGAQGDGSKSYGVELENSTGALVENNIFQQTTAQIMFGEADQSILGYNFAINSAFSGPTGTFPQTSYTGHTPGNQMTLWEGNNFLGIWTDDVHGTTSTSTMFRNMLQGFQAGKPNVPGVIAIRGRHRGYNVVGNVIGQPGYSTGYEGYATSTTTMSSFPNNTTLYELGAVDYSGDACGTSLGMTCDTLVKSTLMRWGNYDVVNGVTRWDSTEAAPGAAAFLSANFSTSYFNTLAHTLPASLYYASTPSWWPSGKNWPPVGPDVITGNVGKCSGVYTGAQGTSSTQCTSGALSAAWASHVTSIPAMDCYFTMGGPPDGSGAVLNFNASTCYTPVVTYTWNPVISPAGNGTLTGTNCAAGVYTAGTVIGPCSAVPNSGFATGSPLWTSATGNAACSGTTNPCPSFTLNSNSGVTANFVTSPLTLSTATVGTGAGVITSCSGTKTVGQSYSCAVREAVGSVLSGVSGCGGTLSGHIYSGSMPSTSCTVTATFSLDSSGSAVVISATEGSNGNSSTGAAPHRNAYTNCANGYSGGVLQPSGFPVGELYCTATDKTAALANGGPNLGVVTSTITGTGTTELDNGHGAGGSNSATSVTATYGGASSSACPVGTNIASGAYNLNLLGSVANAATVYGITTGSSNFNTSSLEPTKWNSAGDTGDHYVRETCQKVSSTSVAGEHLEFDTNYHASTADYFGFGLHFNYTDSKWYYCPQSCSNWQAMRLVNVADGTISTTFTWPVADYVYSRVWMHRGPVGTCTSTSSSNCFFYDEIDLQLFNAGAPVTSLIRYILQDATTPTTIPGGIPVSLPSWTPNQFALQHQWDVNGASANLTNNVDFDNLIAYRLTAGNVATPTFSPAGGTYTGTQSVIISTTTTGSTICYTNDGTVPTANAGTCTNGTAYTVPISVSATTTLKAIGSKSGLGDSSVASATYTITPNYTLSVFNAGAGSGTTSGTNCTTGTYASGTAISCTASAATGSTFTGWSGGSCTGTGTCSFNISANSVVTANFSLNTYTFAVSTSGSGSGTTSGTNCTNGTKNYGTAITCSASANTGSTFSGWSGTGSASSCSGTGSCSFTLAANSTATAAFTINTYTLTATTSGSGTGSLSGTNCTTGTYNYNTAVSCTATPNAGSVFSGWSGACTGTGACSFNMTANQTVTAFFTSTNTLTVSSAGTGSGTISGSNCTTGTYANGTSVTCSASAASGSTFAGWSGTGDASTCSGTGLCAFTISTGATVTATFNAITYTFSQSTTGTGTGTISGSGCSNGTYAQGTSFTCTATPTGGSTFAGWTGTGSASGCTGGTGTCPVTLNANSTLSASFTGTVANPSFSPAGGLYSTTQSVTITDGTAGSTICYTNDGSAPTASSGTCTHGTTYSTAISVAVTQTLKAIASKSGYNNSAVISVTYTIVGPSPPSNLQGDVTLVDMSFQ